MAKTTKSSAERPLQLPNYCCPRKEAACSYAYGQYIQKRLKFLSGAFKRCFYCDKRDPFKSVMKCYGCDTIYHRGCGRKATERRQAAVSAVVGAYRDWCEDLRAAESSRRQRLASTRCAEQLAVAAAETQQQKVAVAAVWDAFREWCDETRQAQSSRGERYRARCGAHRETAPAAVDAYDKWCDEMWAMELSQWEWYRSRRG